MSNDFASIALKKLHQFAACSLRPLLHLAKKSVIDSNWSRIVIVVVTPK
ncbi:unnamed protein product [Haemonchus placei]|uniref:Uncharacterized protein n=1 Tax=Haemonchus placei TaxID=6290 RepID=A0A0N4WXS8_HAEPC|nr:unnamed protein product [Haemonchus placei]